MNEISQVLLAQSVVDLLEFIYLVGERYVR